MFLSRCVGVVWVGVSGRVIVKVVLLFGVFEMLILLCRVFMIDVMIVRFSLELLVFWVCEVLVC